MTREIAIFSFSDIPEKSAATWKARFIPIACRVSLRSRVISLVKRGNDTDTGAGASLACHASIFPGVRSFSIAPNPVFNSGSTITIDSSFPSYGSSSTRTPPPLKNGNVSVVCIIGTVTSPPGA